MSVAGSVVPTFAGPQFIFEEVSRVLYFDADGTGAADAPTAVVTIFGFAGSLVAFDFVFVA